MDLTLDFAAISLDNVPRVGGKNASLGELFRALEWCFTLLFTLEYAARIYSASERWRYVRSFYGLVDLLAILPTYLALVLSGNLRSKETFIDGFHELPAALRSLFFGANQDAVKEADSLGIDAASAVTFEGTGAGARKAFRSISRSISSLRSGRGRQPRAVEGAARGEHSGLCQCHRAARFPHSRALDAPH